jgi:hypothetical protein
LITADLPRGCGTMRRDWGRKENRDEVEEKTRGRKIEQSR